MEKKHDLTTKEYFNLKISLAVSNWINAFILIVLLSVVGGTAFAINQNYNLKLEFGDLNKTVSRHISEQEERNGKIDVFLTGYEEEKRKKKKKEYYARSGNG